MPRFSVVIAVFNKEAYLAKTLQSVLDQTFTDFEVVIVNDGSTDGSEAKILSFKDDRINYFKQENKGAAAARNTAIQKATGDYIALLDADDWWYPNHLELFQKSIQFFPEENVFANAQELEIFEIIKPAQYSFEKHNTKVSIEDYFTASFQTSILHSSNFAVKKDFFKVVGYYNETYKTGEDTDLYIRMGLKTNIAFCSVISSRFLFVEDGLNFSNRSLQGKALFQEYEAVESKNKGLKKFLDLNRFSLCILARLNNENESFKTIYNKINLENLNKKQRLLLNMPNGLLKILLKFKNILAKNGVRLSAFR